MNTGQKISVAMHVGFILAVLLTDSFSARPPERQPAVTDVALVSAAEFAALVGEPAPAADPAPVEARPEPTPEPTPEPAAEPEPTPPPPPAPDPVAEAPVTAPEPVAPPPPATPPAETGTADRPQASVVSPTPSPPDASLRPVQRRADRVAPEAVPEPEPDVQIGRIDQPAVVPDEETAEPEPDAVPEQDPTARAAAATETVTEATELSETEPARRTATAPEVSLRPERRPARPTPPPETRTARAEPAARTPTPTPSAPERPPPREPSAPRADAIADALAQALTGDDGPLAPSSPASSGSGAASGALTQADVDGLRLSVEECWNVGALSTEALQVVVTIGFEMTPDARPVAGSIQMVDASGGGPAAQRSAFEAGRIAIMQCGTHGYGLPSDLYDAWRQVEITFNPARMSFR
ncbi:MAG: energy transducer TonB [Pararhodobacter sp.]